MILIGIGANLSSERFGAPQKTCEAAAETLEHSDQIEVVSRSSWYESAPVPLSDQPNYINAVLLVKTGLTAFDLLKFLHNIEHDFGRVRRERNAPRVLDLDLLAYHDQTIGDPLRPSDPIIPHPRLHERAFVLYPMAEIAPNWIHPKTGEKLNELLENIPQDQICRPVTFQTEKEL